MGKMNWDKARRDERARRRDEWVPPPAPEREGDIKDTRTIREKMQDGELGRG